MARGASFESILEVPGTNSTDCSFLAVPWRDNDLHTLNECDSDSVTGGSPGSHLSCALRRSHYGIGAGLIHDVVRNIVFGLESKPISTDRETA